MTLRKLFFTLWYSLPGRPPWDTGVPPPELRAVVEDPATPPGRALDLGCGTGTNVVYLARRGWNAVGVDFAGRAIAAARRKAREAGVAERATFYVADVTRLDFLEPPFDLGLDMGCFHSIDPRLRDAYARGLARLLRPGALYLLYAFLPGGVGPAVTEEQVRAVFTVAFAVERVERSDNPPSAWYRLRRRDER